MAGQPVKWDTFTTFDHNTLSEGDFIVGYKADGTLNFRITVAEFNEAMDNGFLNFLKSLPGYQSDVNYLGLTTDGDDGIEWKPVSLT